MTRYSLPFIARTMLVAATGFAALAAPAGAQDFREGVYDGRSIMGWQYSEEGSESSGLPTWLPEGETGDGANCNIDITPLEADQSDWLGYFYQVTPANFGQTLREAGMDWQQGYLTEVISLQGRPAMRNLFLAQAEGRSFDVMRVSVSGARELTTITCTTSQGFMLPRLQWFYAFASNIEIMTAPAE